MAHKKAGGSTAWGRDSHGKRLGVKRTEGAVTNAGEIIIRQRGTKYHPGVNVRKGGDDTLYAEIDGFAHFSHKKLKKFDGSVKMNTIVHVLPEKAEKAQ